MSDKHIHGFTNANSTVGASGSGAYSGLIGLGDTNRLDSSLYDEQVDFDFFETGGIQESDLQPVTIPNSLVMDSHTAMAEGSGNSNNAGVELTVTVDPPTPATPPLNRLLLQISTPQSHSSSSSSSSAEGSKPPFSTEKLMAALQDAKSNGRHSDDSILQPDGDKERQHSARVHLFDLTDSEEDDDADELELAEIHGQAQAAAAAIAHVGGGGDELHSWEAHDFYHHQHMQEQQQQNQHERSHRQQHKKRARAQAIEQEILGLAGNGRKSMLDDENLNGESDSEDDEEGYYLSDSERSDITDVTPMSSVACSPMPPFATNAPYSPQPAQTESDDSYDGYPINHEPTEDDDLNCDGIEDELEKISPSEDDDDDDIDEILRILPNSATGQNFEIPTEGNVDPFMKMYRDGPHSPVDDEGVDGEGDQQQDHDRQYTLNSVSAGLNRHYYSVSPGAGTDGAPEGSNTSGHGDKNVGGKQSGVGSNDNNLLTVNYGNTSKSFVDAQRKRMLAAAHAHHTSRHHHHGVVNGVGGLKLNKVHHPTTNSHFHAHHHHHHNHHGTGSYLTGTNHHSNHGHHSHQHHNNYHQQYHNLTMALQRKRQTQQKQIDHDNSILKRKIQNVKPSVEIIKAFGESVSGVANSTSTSSTASTPAPNNNNKKGVPSKNNGGGGGGYASSSTASSICGGSTTSTSTSSGSNSGNSRSSASGMN